MKYEISLPPFYRRVFATPVLRLILSIMILVAIVSGIVFKSLNAIGISLVFPFIIFLIFFVIAFLKHHQFVKSIEVGEKLVIGIFRKDKHYKTHELDYENIKVDFYTLFIGNERIRTYYNENYKVLLIQQPDGTRIISLDAKSGWTEDRLAHIYRQILLKKKQNSGEPTIAAT